MSNREEIFDQTLRSSFPKLIEKIKNENLIILMPLRKAITEQMLTLSFYGNHIYKISPYDENLFINLNGKVLKLNYPSFLPYLGWTKKDMKINIKEQYKSGEGISYYQIDNVCFSSILYNEKKLISDEYYFAVYNRFTDSRFYVDFSKAYQLCNRLLEARPTDLSLLQLQKRLGAMKQYRSSGTLPHFSAKDTNGKLVTDSLLNAKANVIMVWASWNQDSQGILRRLHQLRKEHPKDINVVSICVDASPSEGAYVLRYDSIQWPNICDGQLWDSPVMTQLGISFVPDNIVIDKKRKIVGRSLRGEQLVEKIESLLKE